MPNFHIKETPKSYDVCIVGSVPAAAWQLMYWQMLVLK